MKCDKCKYARWHRTTAGSLHPNKEGACQYKKTIPLPASANTLQYGLRGSAIGLEVNGGPIERGAELRSPCAYYGVD